MSERARRWLWLGSLAALFAVLSYVLQRYDKRA